MKELTDYGFINVSQHNFPGTQTVKQIWYCFNEINH